MDNEKNFEEQAHKERLAYYKKWRAIKKDKVKIYNKNYWQRKAEKRADKNE